MTIETGTAMLTSARSGALNIYVKKGIAQKVDLETGKEVKVIWDSEKRELCIKEL
jgi:hypothetical protein